MTKKSFFFSLDVKTIYKFVSYNIPIFWPFSMNDLEFIFLLHDIDSEMMYC